MYSCTCTFVSNILAMNNFLVSVDYRIAGMFRRVKVSFFFFVLNKQERKFNPQKKIIRRGHSLHHVTVTQLAGEEVTAYVCYGVK